MRSVEHAASFIGFVAGLPNALGARPTEMEPIRYEMEWRADLCFIFHFRVFEIITGHFQNADSRALNRMRL